MKGITHFTIGVMAASCIPSAVASAAEGNSLYFVLGGVFGILPDTLDFKFYRFCYGHDVEVRPDPKAYDAQVIADGVAYAVNSAYADARPLKLKLGTVQLSDDQWQSYAVSLDVINRRVAVTMGPTVDAGGNTSLIGTNRDVVRSAGSADLITAVKLDYFADITVDIFDGPIIGLVPEGDKVRVSFLPWHRSWTHSFVLGAVFGLGAWIFWDTTAALAVFAAYGLHILVDQLGFMGSNLWFPFTKTRKFGAMKMQSGDAVLNFAFVWLACLIIFWNLYLGSGFEWRGLTSIKLFFYGAILPGALFGFLRRRLKMSRLDD